jgi:peptide subunit release factor RF-3
MTLRDKVDARKRQAHEILDQVKAGLKVEVWWIRWALVVLGDGTE